MTQELYRGSEHSREQAALAPMLMGPLLGIEAYPSQGPWGFSVRV